MPIAYFYSNLYYSSVHFPSSAQRHPAPTARTVSAGQSESTAPRDEESRNPSFVSATGAPMADIGAEPLRQLPETRKGNSRAPSVTSGAMGCRKKSWVHGAVLSRYGTILASSLRGPKLPGNRTACLQLSSCVRQGQRGGNTSATAAAWAERPASLRRTVCHPFLKPPPGGAGAGRGRNGAGGADPAAAWQGTGAARHAGAGTTRWGASKGLCPVPPQAAVTGRGGQSRDLHGRGVPESMRPCGRCGV